MAWIFGDGFDCYAAFSDAYQGYWDSGVSGWTLTAGRFAGSQALQVASTAANLVKSSGQNDALHHIVCAFNQSATLGTSALGLYFQLGDGATAQCSIVFNRNGTITLTSGGPGGTTLATYASAFTVVSTWYQFEFEVLISNTAGYMNVRKNGNTSNDFSSATNLNTRVSANNYANRLTVGQSVVVSNQNVDDLLWRSDASTLSWSGDIRAYTRMPASDASVQFSRTPANYTQTPFTFLAPSGTSATTARYSPFIPAFDGTISAGTVLINTAFTGSLKCSVFNGTTTTITTVLSSATTMVNPTTGANTITFPSPFSVTRGTQYWIGFETDSSYSNGYSLGSGTTGLTSTTTYAAFPAANNPVATGQSPIVYSMTIGTSANNNMVNEAQQDATTSYVYDSTAGHADFYGIAAIASTPVSTIAVTTRGYMQKSDAGSRTAAVQLKSGGTTVASPTLTLTTSGWTWAWRTDVTDPNTSAAWTAAAVNNVNVGPVVVS